MSKWEWDSDGEGGWELFRGEKGLCQVLQPQGAADLLNTLEAHLAELATHTCATCAEWAPRHDVFGQERTDIGGCFVLADHNEDTPVTPASFGCGKWHGKAVTT